MTGLCALLAAINIFGGVSGLLYDTNPILIALNFSVAFLCFCAFVYATSGRG